MELAGDLARGTLDALALNLAVLDSDGEILASNRGWKRFGQFNDIDGPVDTAGENYLSVTERADEDTYARRAGRGIRRILEGERDTFKLEYPCHSPTQKRWFLMHASRVSVEGTPYVVVAHEDITERKMAELEVARRNEELESFARLLSHDLRNPLAVAMGRAELVAEDVESPHVDPLLSALDRMEEIIANALSLMQARDEELDRERIHLEGIVERAWANVETPESTVRTEGNAVFEGDPRLLGNAFENLFRNAVEHADGTVEVTVGTLDDGFYVEDDGPGIPEDERGEVFDIGYTTNEGGTGFGLGIVEHVIEEHGWEIDVVTGDDGGARFEVYVRPTFPEPEYRPTNRS